MIRISKGLTLIEIVVALAVFAIVVVSFLPAFLFIAQLNIVSKAGIDVTVVAQKEAERFYSYSRTASYDIGIKNKSILTIVEGDKSYTYVVIGTEDVEKLTRSDSDVNVEIYFWNNTVQFPNMTKIRVIVSLKNNSQHALPEQIDSILLFK